MDFLNEKNESYNNNNNNIESLQASMMQTFSENCCQFQLRQQRLEEVA
jgi:hypothetical protein